MAERQAWDATLMDGLDPHERWTEDGRCLNPEPPPEGTACRGNGMSTGYMSEMWRWVGPRVEQVRLR